MAWNTGVSYTSASVLSASLVNGVGNDLRAWGGDVNGGGFKLSNVDLVLKSVLQLTSTTTPTAPSINAETKCYQKGSKVIFVYNDGGTVRYKYLDMAGTGVTWVHTTAAP